MNKKRRNLTSLNLLLIFLALIFSIACNKNGADQSPQQISETDENAVETPTFPTPQIDLAEPLKISEQPADTEKCGEINQIIENSEFSNARWGVIVISLKDGRVVCGRDARKLFSPASVQKVLISIVALDKLGADFRWQTKVFAENQIGQDGVLNGNLILYGQGAPDFDKEGVEQLAAQLQAKGLKRVKGDIIGDESFFRGDALGDGWTWNDLQWYYGAEASALTINENQASIYSQNGTPTASTDYVEVVSKIEPVRDVAAVGIKRELGENKFYVWGQGNNVGARVAVEKPALWSSKILKEALEKKGIAVEGAAKSVDWKSENKPNAETFSEIASVESKTLGEIVRRMNKRSVNLYAELILRTIGRKFGDEAPDANPGRQKLRGDDTAGASVLKKWLAEKKVATEEIEIHDASGLSRLNNVTPEAFGRALIYAAQANFAETFKSSLPVAATDGTLAGRLGRARGKIMAKTGSITYVNALAGYAKKSEDETFAFVILCNNQTRKADSSSVIDAVALSLIGD